MFSTPLSKSHLSPYCYDVIKPMCIRIEESSSKSRDVIKPMCISIEESSSKSRCVCSICTTCQRTLTEGSLLENPYGRFFVYMKALNVAANGKAMEHILPYIEKILASTGDKMETTINIGVFVHGGQECMIAGRWLDLASLMLTLADLLFSKASEKDLECIFTVICNLVQKPKNLDESIEMAKLLSTKIAQQRHEKPAL